MNERIRSFRAGIDALRVVLRASEKLPRRISWADQCPSAPFGGQR
jgi:hypothetical protein